MSQLRILKKIKNITDKNFVLDNETSLKDYFFFTTWSSSLGEVNLKKIIDKKKNIIFFITSILKFTIKYSISDLDKYKLSGLVSSQKKKNLIISYTNNSKLLKNYDNYFSCKIKNSRKTEWFLINLDNYEKKNKLSNFSVLSKKKNYFYLNYKFYLNLFKFFFFLLFKKRELINFNFNQSLKIEIKKILEKSTISKVFIPYESQPHQHFIIKVIKSINDKIKIIGYLHSSLTPLPTDFIYKKKYEPDLLIVHGASQKEILIKHLGWKSKIIKNLKSFRYQKKTKKYFQGKIFLPFSLINPSSLIDNLKKYIETSSFNLNGFKIINHPYMLNSNKHREFIDRVKNLKDLKLSQNINYKNISIVIGVSAIILEMLENNIEVIHVCSEPIYEKHSSDIWKNIRVEKLANGVYSYKIKKFKSLINFGKKNSFIEKYKIY